MGTGQRVLTRTSENDHPPSEPAPRTGGPPRLLKPAGQRTNELLLPVASGRSNPGTEIRPGQGGSEKPKQERQQQARVNTGCRPARPASPKGLGTGNNILPGVPAVLRADQRDVSQSTHRGSRRVAPTRRSKSKERRQMMMIRSERGDRIPAVHGEPLSRCGHWTLGAYNFRRSSQSPGAAVCLTRRLRPETGEVGLI